MRRCIIVGNPGVMGDDHYCNGVNIDLQNYQQFLLSPLGGLWDEEEIVLLKRPSRNDFISALENVSKSDHFLFVFSGHGWYSSESNSTILEVRSNIDFDSEDLKEYGNSRLLILDCCRKVSAKYIRDELFEERVQKAEPTRLNPLECRKYYDRAIEECGDCSIVLHSCSEGERSGDDSQRGGYFSFSLLQAIRELYRESNVNTTKEYKSITSPKTFENTVPKVKRLSGGSQNPTIEKPRSGEYLPLAIIA